MKSVFWTKIKHSKRKSTVWELIGDADDVEFDRQGLMRQFSSKSSMKAAVPRAQQAEAGTTFASVLSFKRQQNCSIALARLPLDTDDIRSALIAMDETVLNESTVMLLKALVPLTEEGEDEALTEMANQAERMGLEPAKALPRIDWVMLNLGRVPEAASRLQCLSIMHRLDTEVPIAGEAVAFLRGAIAAVKGSQPLRCILQHALAVGNFLNGGTSRGGAWAISLSSLGKLAAVKSSDSKSNALQFCIRQAGARYDGGLSALASELAADFRPLMECRMTIASVKDMANQFQQDSKTIRALHTTRQMDPTPVGDDDVFPGLLEEFSQDTADAVSQLQGAVKQLEEVFLSTMQYYGEDGESLGWEGAVSLFSQVVTEGRKVTG
jgi:diaphanous 1